jgi:hypothetical protein
LLSEKRRKQARRAVLRGVRNANLSVCDAFRTFSATC